MGGEGNWVYGQQVRRLSFILTILTSLLASGIHAGIKLRPTAAELATLGPAFESVWKSVFANAPDKGVFWTGILAAQLGPANPERVEKYFTHAYILVRT
jgi:hypothetical protein